MTEEQIEKFTAFCKDPKNGFELGKNVPYNYKSLSVCIIDCVYSLRQKYTTTVKVVDRYAAKYMDGDREKAGDSLSDFIERVETVMPENFADTVLNNRTKSGGVLKTVVCLNLARQLKALEIESVEDFKNFESQKSLEESIRRVKGMGDAGTNYLFMLAGDPNRCKLDVHIQRCVEDAVGIRVNDKDCQGLFSATVENLKADYPQITVRSLDGAIWQVYHNKKVSK